MYLDFFLWRLTQGVRLRIAFCTAIGLAAGIVGIARLALLGWLLAKIFQSPTLDSLLLPASLVGIVMILRGWLEYWRNMVAHKTAAIVQKRLRLNLYDKIAELGPAFLGSQRTGTTLLSVVEGVEQLEVYFGQYLPQLGVAIFVPIALFGFVAFLDMPVALVMFAFALFTLLAPIAFHSWDSDSARARQKAYADFGSEFLDSIQGLGTLQAFGQSAARGQSLASKAHDLFRKTMWVLATNSLTRGITDIGITVGAALMLGLGAYRVSEGLMSLTALLMVLMMGTEVFRPLRELRALLHNGMLGRSAAEGIHTLLNQVPFVPRDSTTATHQSLTPSITFDDVCFSYPGSKHLAHDRLNLVINEEQRVGIVGASGCGKSTILKLLLRLYDPQSGTVSIGGHDIRSLSRDGLYSHIAVVNQDPYLFHGTVLDNLLFGKRDASERALKAACTAANAHDFIEKLPNGYETIIGERGIKLSVGQRQRLAIARALLRNAPILVLDEALSAVDAENEALIQQALERAMEGRTTLIFAHRLSSVKDADHIFVLADGHLSESGKHDALLSLRGDYFNLMANQIGHHDSNDTETIEHSTRAKIKVTSAHQLNPTVYDQRTEGILKADGLSWSEVIKELLRMITPWRTKLLCTFLLGVMRVTAFIGVGVLSALIVAAIKNGLDYNVLLIALGVAAPVAGILHWLESWIAHDMAFRLLAELRIALFKKIDSLGPAYLVRRRSGDLLATATHDVELIEYFFAHTVAPAFVAILVPLMVLGTLCIFSWQIALGLAPFLLLVGTSPILLRSRLDRLGSSAREALGELNAHVVDTIQGLGEIVAYQQISVRRRELSKKIDTHNHLRLPFFRDLTIQMSILEIATGLGGLCVVVIGATLASHQLINPAFLPLLAILSMSAFLPVSEIAHIGRQLADTLGATRRLYAVHNEHVIVQDSGTSTISRDNVSIKIDNVVFSYFSDYRLALNQVTLQARPGQMVALVGPSGSGKTTLAHLLLRFWDPNTGQISIAGKNLRDFSLESLRNSIALVAQDTYLFNDTLEANIKIANPTASELELGQALENASLNTFIASLPEGLKTPVGERGARLSGGQRQRIAIARAFLKDAPILILDEATSHLDAINEKVVHDALETLMKNRTTIVIAHRLSTIRKAHQIVVIDSGEIIENGSHKELLANRKFYYQLIQHQIAGVA